MPRYNPGKYSPTDDFDDDFSDDFDNDFGDGFDDDFDDDFGRFGDFDNIEDFDDINPYSREYARLPSGRRETEEWESYLDRMDPARGRAHERRHPPARREPEPRRHPEARRAPTPVRYPEQARAPKAKKGAKKQSRAWLAALVLVLLAAGAGLYVWFFTDLYYVASVKLNSSGLDMFVGEQITVGYDLISFGSGTPDLKWSSSDTSVAEVDGQGNVSAHGAGSTSVMLIEPSSGLSARCTVTVHEVTEMVVDKTFLTLGAGETCTVSVQTGAAGTEQPEFVSADNAVAAVDSAGTVTAAAAGQTEITVSARGFSDVTLHVSVLSAPSVISPSDAGGMCMGETRRMTAALPEGEFCSKYSYSSDNPSVVSVDESGLMTAVGEGTANLTVSAYNGVSCTVPLTVGREAGEVTVPQKLTVYNGLPKALEASDSTGNCRQFYYTSSDPEIVQVDEQGNLYSLKPGTATITCTSYNGNSARCSVTAKIVDHTTPYTSRRVRENIVALEAAYPELISSGSIGSSVQGRDISLVKLGTGERKVLVVAGMHSRENITVNYTMRCIEEYARAFAEGKRYAEKYNVKKLLSEYTVYIVPLLNPDGLDIIMGEGQPEYTDQPLTEEELAEFKNTANGVNLNRNFPFEWGHEGINTTTPDGRSYAGSSAGSEPEAQAIISLCADNEFEWLLDIHCKGHLIYYQDKVTGEMPEASKLARRLHSRCEFTLTDKSTLKEISGGLENWFRKEYGRPGICVELVGSRYNPSVNEYFESKLDWNRTRGVFLMCLED